MRRILWTLALYATSLYAQGGTIGGSSSSSVTYPLTATNGSAAAPSYSYTNSLTTGIYRFGADTIGFAIAGVNAFQIPALGKLVGGAGNMTILAGTGNSRTMTLQTTNSTGVVKNTMTLGADSSALVLGQLIGRGVNSTLTGTAAAPSYIFNASQNTGFYYAGSSQVSDTIRFSVAGITALGLSGGASATLTGGAGNMTIVAGTGNSRTITLKTTTSGGVATTALTLNADQSITPTSVGGIVGTTTNDNAQALSIGEYVSGSRASGSSLSLSTGTTLTVDSISLTAGDWDVEGSVAFTFGATTSITNLTGGISTTTNTLGALGTAFDWETAANIPTAGADAVWVTPMTRISIASTTTVFLVAQGTFTASTLKGYGAMRARRVR